MTAILVITRGVTFGTDYWWTLSLTVTLKRLPAPLPPRYTLDFLLGFWVVISKRIGGPFTCGFPPSKAHCCVAASFDTDTRLHPLPLSPMRREDSVHHILWLPSPSPSRGDSGEIGVATREPHHKPTTAQGHELIGPRHPCHRAPVCPCSRQAFNTPLPAGPGPLHRGVNHPSQDIFPILSFI